MVQGYTVISYSRKGYVVLFDGFVPEENEVVKSLNKERLCH